MLRNSKFNSLTEMKVKYSQNSELVLITDYGIFSVVKNSSVFACEAAVNYSFHAKYVYFPSTYLMCLTIISLRFYCFSIHSD